MITPMEQLLLVRLAEALPHEGELVSLLNEPLKGKALRYVRAEDRVRSAVASLLIRRYVGEGNLRYGEHGKPFMDGARQFNISHGGGFVGIFVSDKEVGLDIEEISRCDLKIVPAAMTSSERMTILTQEDFAYAWTWKEAVSKCLGTGIEKPTEIGLERQSMRRFGFRGETYYVESYETEGHVVSLARGSEGEFPKPTFVSIEELVNETAV